MREDSLRRRSDRCRARDNEFIRQAGNDRGQKNRDHSKGKKNGKHDVLLV
jgi:hypothetical protein